jgi:IS5 family transposase
VRDSHELSNLLRGEQARLYGDSTYRGQKQRERLKQIAPKVHQQADACDPRARLGWACVKAAEIGAARALS